MQNSRIKKIASLLVEHCARVKQGEYVEINSKPKAEPLIKEIYKQVILKGAYPRLNLSLDGIGYIYYKHATPKQLKKFPEIAYYEAKKTDAFITVDASENLKELSTIDPKKIALRRKVIDPISKEVLKKKWVIFAYPTAARAQLAEMSLEEFEDFVYNACFLDWEKESKNWKKLAKLLNKTDKIRILADDTDIRFSIKGRNAVVDDATYNMPGGEVFTAPLEKSTQGYIKFSFPAVYGGKEINGVYLEFKNGRVVKAKAEKNQDYLQALINIDKGSKYLGELGIGCNYRIKKFVKQILFDEKIGGTIHLALGNAYKECKGTNKSALHMDMIVDLRKSGEVYADDRLIIKNGKFVF